MEAVELDFLELANKRFIFTGIQKDRREMPQNSNVTNLADWAQDSWIICFPSPCRATAWKWKDNSQFVPQGGSKHRLWGRVRAGKSARGKMGGVQGQVNSNQIFPLRWYLTAPRVKVRL